MVKLTTGAWWWQWWGNAAMTASLESWDVIVTNLTLQWIKCGSKIISAEKLWTKIRYAWWYFCRVVTACQWMNEFGNISYVKIWFENRFRFWSQSYHFYYTLAKKKGCKDWLQLAQNTNITHIPLNHGEFPIVITKPRD